MSEAVLGAVLVGGASRRMGEDKAALALDGTPMVHRVARALFGGGVGSVVFVGGDDRIEGWIADGWPGQGPLGGLATAVRHGATAEGAEGGEGVEVVVVAACDQPDLTPELIGSLVRSLHAAPEEAVGCAVRTGDGRLHPFPSAWRVGAADALAALVDGGARRADAAFAIGPIIEVAGDGRALTDLDTPADVQAWQTLREGETQPPGNHP